MAYSMAAVFKLECGSRTIRVLAQRLDRNRELHDALVCNLWTSSRGADGTDARHVAVRVHVHEVHEVPAPHETVDV